jgi:hypothetical protein
VTRQSIAMVVLSAILVVVLSDRTGFSDSPKERYVFVSNTDRYIGIFRGDWRLIGKLDANGDFIQEIKLKKGQPASSIPAHGILNFPGLKPKKVYEFRSGGLIPGEIRPDGSFVPEAGGKIIPFKDYQYSPTATPIWNLPGVFLTEEEATKLKKAKPASKK